MISSNEFRKGMSKFVTGVTLLTTIDENNDIHGMTVNALTSVCLEPPSLLVCVAHATKTHALIESSGYFGISILAENQLQAGEYYSQKLFPKDPHRAFGISKKGYPGLGENIAYFGCDVVMAYNHGDHTIYIAEVKEMSFSDSRKPLTFFNSKFNNL